MGDQPPFTIFNLVHMWLVAAETVLLLVMSFLSSVLLLVAAVAAYFGSVFACGRVSIVCFSLFLFS